MTSALIVGVFWCSLFSSKLAVAKAAGASKPLRSIIKGIAPRSVAEIRYLTMEFALKGAKDMGLLKGDGIRHIIDVLGLYHRLPSVLRSKGISAEHTSIIGKEIIAGNAVLVNTAGFRVLTSDDVLFGSFFPLVADDSFLIDWKPSTITDPAKLFLHRIAQGGDEETVVEPTDEVSIATVFLEDNFSLAAAEIAMRNVTEEEEQKVQGLLGDRWRDYVFYVLSRIESIDLSFEDFIDSSPNEISEYISKLLYLPSHTLDNLSEAPQIYLIYSLREVYEGVYYRAVVPEKQKQTEEKDIATAQVMKMEDGKRVVADILLDYGELLGKKKYNTKKFITEMKKLGWEDMHGKRHAKLRRKGKTVSGITRTGRANGNNILVGRRVQIVKEMIAKHIEQDLEEMGITIEDMLIYDRKLGSKFLTKKERDAMNYIYKLQEKN